MLFATEPSSLELAHTGFLLLVCVGCVVIFVEAVRGVFFDGRN